MKLLLLHRAVKALLKAKTRHFTLCSSPTFTLHGHLGHQLSCFCFYLYSFFLPLFLFLLLMKLISFPLSYAAVKKGKCDDNKEFIFLCVLVFRITVWSKTLNDRLSQTDGPNDLLSFNNFTHFSSFSFSVLPHLFSRCWLSVWLCSLILVSWAFFFSWIIDS